MFSLGKEYRIIMIVSSSGEWTHEAGVWTVLDVEGSLIKLGNPHSSEKIVNTASWHFVSAEPA